MFFRFGRSGLVLLLLFLGASAQTVTEWETLRPANEVFSVLMPKGSSVEISKEPYHKMELNWRLYSSRPSVGQVLAVVSLSGIKPNPAAYTELQRFNSYVDAFKTLFPRTVQKDLPVKLTLLGEKTLQGNEGREYRVVLGNLSGRAQTFLTRRRFYAVVFLSEKKDETAQEKFLSSFLIPEKTSEPPAAVAAQNATSSENEKQDAASPKETVTDTPVKAGVENTDATESGRHSKAKTGPISGGLLNGKAISLPAPEYPAQAKTEGASGTVVVRVIIDEQGNVASAEPVSGPVSLRQAAVNAAMQARFSPTLLVGEPVQVMGIITYNFVRP